MSIQLLPPPPIETPMYIQDDNGNLRLTQGWQDYFNAQWTTINQIINSI